MLYMFVQVWLIPEQNLASLYIRMLYDLSSITNELHSFVNYCASSEPELLFMNASLTALTAADML